jgi:hypothetical protein
MATYIEQIRAAEVAKLRALSTLHTELGYGSAQELATAILRADGSVRSGAPKGTKSSAAPSSKSGRGRRIDEATKRQALAALKAGQAGVQVAKEFGVSYPTIQNWKSELGLVKSRGRKPKK